ncbi:hypothetical protein FSP39_023861 [Pinctada imbricata]|uniref:B box-type domain-containing protein n=1 Tax=Pinctada imbricata TaxID=66713 RepID=A0AA88Y9R4_PINIB|nr:hypothetical protein FSP39_023861 [Pinctada imbricata]
MKSIFGNQYRILIPALVYLQSNKMATCLEEFQFALRTCENHDQKELIGYCKTCQEKICSSCIKEEHATHNWETITDILRDKKRTLPKECKEIQTNHLPCLRKELSQFDMKIEEENIRLERNEATLNGSRQSYISKINRLFDDKINECRQKSETAKQIYKDKREGLKQKVEFLDLMTTSLDKEINTLPDHDILDMEKEMREELEKALSYSAEMYTSTTVFVPGLMDVQVLENIIGEIHSVSVEEKYTIERYSEPILSINHISDAKAWILNKSVRRPKLLDNNGKEVKCIENKCSDFIISRSGEFVLTSIANRNVSVFSEDENEIRRIDTESLLPINISKTENEDILVTLVESGDAYNLVPTSRRIVQRMTLTGKVLHTYEFKDDGKTRLFIWPRRTSENKNTNICVVNKFSEDSGELVALHRDGRVKFTYKGDGLKFSAFLPVDVKCDSKCHVLVTELNNRSIHMLSSEGMFLSALFQFDKLHPMVMSLHDDNLWCGFRDGKVKVFKYIN